MRLAHAAQRIRHNGAIQLKHLERLGMTRRCFGAFEDKAVLIAILT